MKVKLKKRISTDLNILDTSGYPTLDLLSVQNLKLKILSVIIKKNIFKKLFSYRFKLRPPLNIGGGTHFSSGTKPDSGGTFVPPFKLLKYALRQTQRIIIGLYGVHNGQI